MPTIPKRVRNLAFHRAVGAVRVAYKSGTSKVVDVPPTAATDGLADLDKVPVCVVVLGSRSADDRHVLVLNFGDDQQMEAAVQKATDLAIDAWRRYASDNSATLPDGGAVLVPKWSASGGSPTKTRIRAPRAAVGVVVATTWVKPEDANNNLTPTGHKAGADAAAERRAAVTVKQGLGPEDFSPTGLILRPEMELPVATAASDNAEGMFQQYRGAIVWIDENDEEQLVADFNAVRTWEIAVARDRAAAALVAGEGNEPYGGKVLFGGAHGAVGVYSQASSGSSSAGTIVEFVQDEYEANA